MTKKHLMGNRINSNTQFSYNSVKKTGSNRRPTTNRVKSEDLQLNRPERKTATGTARDDHRNNVLLRWMVEHHLNYVSRFKWFFRSGDKQLDEEVAGLMTWHSLKNNFDTAQRHNRDRWIRLWEQQKILCGDIFAIKAKTGQLQAIEPDRVTRPDDWNGRKPNPKLTEHGLLLDSLGAMKAAAICNRDNKTTSSSMKLDHMEKAENLVVGGYYSRFDQTRGISPILTALSLFADVDDGLYFNLLKVKLQALFGVAFFRDSIAPMGQDDPAQSEDEDGDPEEEGYKVGFQPDKLTVLDLDPGDDVKMLQSDSPAESVVTFSELEIRMVMRILDIPFTAFDSMKSSQSARVADRNEYEQAAEWKREANADTLYEIYEWRFNHWYETNESFSKAMDNAGYSVRKLMGRLKWIPAGSPWLNKLDEMKANVLGVSLGVDSSPAIAARHGENAFDMIDQQAAFLDYAKEQNVPLVYADSGKEAIQAIPIEPAQPEDPPANNGGNNE